MAEKRKKGFPFQIVGMRVSERGDRGTERRLGRACGGNPGEPSLSRAEIRDVAEQADGNQI